MSSTKTDTTLKRKVKTILISQPTPENGKSPYFDLAKKHKLTVDFRPFIHVEGVNWKDFRKKNRVNLPDFTAIIFTSKNAIEHFFRVCKEARIEMPAQTKYICRSEAIGLYLQKYIQYRKRKVFFGKGSYKDLQTLLKKHKTEKYLLPCSDVNTRSFPEFLTENEFDWTEAVIYKTVSSDLSDLENIFYDMIVFFSPLGLKSLFENFPDFEQKNTRLAVFGPATAKSMEDYDLRIDIRAPAPASPSMTMAIEKYVTTANK